MHKNCPVEAIFISIYLATRQEAANTGVWRWFKAVVTVAGPDVEEEFVELLDCVVEAQVAWPRAARPRERRGAPPAVQRIAPAWQGRSSESIGGVMRCGTNGMDRRQDFRLVVMRMRWQAFLV
jgi:hypothetical protein